MKSILRLPSLWLLVVVAVTGCEGDSRPFTEAAEVQSLGLQTIEPTLPPGSLARTVLNPGQQLQLGITANANTGLPITVSATDRDWRSTNPAFFTVDANGLLTARANGIAEAYVVIGGIESDRIEVEVFQSELAGINEIQGADMVERCIPQAYTATGAFRDDSVRLLDAIDWQFVDPQDAATRASVVGSDDATGTVTAFNPGSVQLVARVGDIQSDPKPLEISDSLQEVTVVPASGSAVVTAGSTKNFAATGTYSTAEADGTTRDVTITNSVDWEITSGSNFATVVQEGENRGLVTGISAGTFNLLARCGMLSSTPRQVTVVAQENTSGDGISFNIPSEELVLSLEFNPTQTLQVSTGDEFSSSNNVTSEVVWTDNFTGTGISPIVLPLDTGADSVTLRAQEPGSVVITAEFEGESTSLTVRVLE
jgi:hypothetical protein